jgi:anti-anti-sigma factor
VVRDVNTPDAGRAGGDALPAARPADPGSVHVILGGRKTRVVLTGEIDAELGPDLIEAAADAEDAGRPVEVDVQHVSFMDSTGVAFLARLASRCVGDLVLIKPPELVQFLIDVTSIREVLTVVDEDPGVDTTLPDGDDTGPPDLIA